MNPLLILGLGVGLLWLYSGSAYAAKKTYPPMGTKFFPAKAGDRILLTGEMSSPNWDHITKGIGADMPEYLTSQFKEAMGARGSSLEGLSSTPLPNGVKFAVVIKYATDTNIPLGQMVAPIQLPGPGGTTAASAVESGTIVFISAKNIDTGQEVSV